ncbi:ABC transporter ATP-binding protein [Dethiosulfatarculus sandiegensis]|uniref:ABC transporter ATP-binding protein n=1 Tax=Dethiosulfatarculus sandiegensis TaxID=1429043 RepID=A0A0D2HYS7_9BACT|nr:ABC transporter ATP-binding protein [Dethiosulfatarculus sandiegensis]KIX15438.1 hypothetical protein X474_03860 [Dethiosulfatarculus sandiegensis]
MAEINHLFTNKTSEAYSHLKIKNTTILLLFVLTVLMALFEGAGLGMLLPLLAFVQSGAPQGDGLLHDFMQKVLSWSEIFGKDYELVLLLSATLLVIMVRYFINYLRDARLARLRLDITRRLRKMLLGALLQAGLGYIAESKTGELQAGLTTECERAAESAAAKVAVITSGILIVIYISLLLLLSPLLTLFTIPVLALVGLLLNWQRKKSRNLTYSVSQQNMSLGNQVSETLRGITRIKMRGQQNATGKKLSETIERIFTGMLGLEKLRLLVEISMHPLLALAGLTVIYLAVKIIQVDMVILGVFLFILLRMAPQVNLLVSLWAYYNSCRASLERVTGLIRQAEACEEATGGGLSLSLNNPPEIKTTDVTFKYSGAKDKTYAIEDISCQIAAGSLTAVVGRSGAGKSTLISLLAAHHAPTKGRIEFNGVPLKEYSLSNLRRRIGLVEQNPFLFNSTIRQNLNFGRQTPLDETGLQNALKESGSLDFVERLEQGLETLAGEQGSRLSQGQRQRLAIAHSLAIDARLLILDEPTSALDKTSELIIARTLRRLAGKLTVVVIAHRLETVRRADLILVLDKGRLTAKGDHASLLQTSGIYRELFGD